MSPISTKFTEPKHLELSVLINNRVTGNEECYDLYESFGLCCDSLYLYFTHLDPAQHNIFSPNIPCEKYKFIVFLSGNSLRITTMEVGGLVMKYSLVSRHC